MTYEHTIACNFFPISHVHVHVGWAWTWLYGLKFLYVTHMNMAYGLIIPYGMDMCMPLWTKDPISNGHGMAYGVDFVSFYNNFFLNLNKILLVVNYLMPIFFHFI